MKLRAPWNLASGTEVEQKWNAQENLASRRTANSKEDFPFELFPSFRSSSSDRFSGSGESLFYALLSTIQKNLQFHRQDRAPTARGVEDQFLEMTVERQ